MLSHKFSRASRAFAIVLVLTVSGCVKYEEHIDVDASGGGSVTIVLQRPISAVQETAPSPLAAQFREAEMRRDLPDSIKLDWTRSASESGGVLVTATYTFDNIELLLGWAARNPSPLSNISVVRNRGGLDFTRRFAKISPNELEWVRMFCSELTMTSTLKVSGTLKSSNATRTEGSTATWEFKAPELFDPPGRTLIARYSTLPAMWVIALIALALVAGVAMIFRRLKHRN